MVDELGTEGTQEILCQRTLGKFSRVVGDTLISQHMGSIIGAPKCCGWRYCWSLGHHQSQLCALVSPPAKSARCRKRAGAEKYPVHLKSLSQQVVIPTNRYP